MDTTDNAIEGYACNECGRLIFRTEHILGIRPLWDLGEYDGECYLISDVADWSGLRRYDVSLHEGWYCCQFIVMRMTQDKFGTGDTLLVYTDSVHPVRSGESSTAQPKPRGATMLTGRDIDTVLNGPRLAGALAVVKFGAIWCPPCRLMDKAIDAIEAAGGIDGVRFFDVDIDRDQAVAARFRNQSIPYVVLYRDGVRIPIVNPDRSLPLLDGGVIGGLGSRAIVALVTAARDQLIGRGRSRDAVTPFAEEPLRPHRGLRCSPRPAGIGRARPLSGSVATCPTPHWPESSPSQTPSPAGRRATSSTCPADSPCSTPPSPPPMTTTNSLSSR